MGRGPKRKVATPVQKTCVGVNMKCTDIDEPRMKKKLEAKNAHHGALKPRVKATEGGSGDMRDDEAIIASLISCAAGYERHAKKKAKTFYSRHVFFQLLLELHIECPLC